MPAPAIWLLPGLDGTGSLFGPLQSALGPGQVVRPFSYPSELGSYDALLEFLPSPTEPVVLVAESFAGPLAVRLAARERGRGLVHHLVLAASFVRAPRAFPGAAAVLLRLAPPPPAWAVRRWMVDAEAAAGLLAAVRAAIAATPRATLSRRLDELLRVDVRSLVATLGIPVTCLVAGRDRLVPAAAAAEAAALAPRGAVVAIDAPHLVLQCAATRAAQAIAAAAG